MAKTSLDKRPGRARKQYGRLCRPYYIMNFRICGGISAAPCSLSPAEPPRGLDVDLVVAAYGDDYDAHTLLFPEERVHHPVAEAAELYLIAAAQIRPAHAAERLSDTVGRRKRPFRGLRDGLEDEPCGCGRPACPGRAAPPGYIQLPRAWLTPAPRRRRPGRPALCRSRA